MSTCFKLIPNATQIGTTSGNAFVTTAAYPLITVDPACSVNSFRLYTVTETSGMTVSDGVTLGWAVAAVWLVAFGISFLTGLVRDEMREKNDVGDA